MPTSARRWQLRFCCKLYYNARCGARDGTSRTPRCWHLLSCCKPKSKHALRREGGRSMSAPTAKTTVSSKYYPFHKTGRACTARCGHRALHQFQAKAQNTKKKPHPFGWSLCWRYLFSQPVARQLSSAQMSLTSVFGMGTGGPSSQSTPTRTKFAGENSVLKNAF